EELRSGEMHFDSAVGIADSKVRANRAADWAPIITHLLNHTGDRRLPCRVEFWDQFVSLFTCCRCNEEQNQRNGEENFAAAPHSLLLFDCVLSLSHTARLRCDVCHPSALFRCGDDCERNSSCIGIYCGAQHAGNWIDGNGGDLGVTVARDHQMLADAIDGE